MKGSSSIVKKLAHLRQLIPGDQTNIPISREDIEFIFEVAFNTFVANASDHQYCPACGSRNVRMNMNEFHLDMERICIAYSGSCEKCGKEIKSCQVLLDQFGRLTEMIEKKFGSAA